jgi:glycosyltransferase involved in cell wall biosynthesis
MIGVSVVIPLRNGAAFIRETLESVWAQNHEPLELIVVDDRSTDRGAEIVREVAGEREITLLNGDGRGAAAAMNKGLRRARYSIVCQIDQDVVLRPGWMSALVRGFDADDVAAVQGIYVTDQRARLLSRVMARDLEERYAAIRGETDHVCTGNVAYRLNALQQIGFFDEQLGYGYDNDLSYRLRAAGYRLIIAKEATSFHRWRDDVTGYFRQQYGFGYGRLDVLAKHPSRVGGDSVSPTVMMLHPVLLVLSLMLLIAGAAGIGNATALTILGVSLIAALMAERTIAGIRAALRFRDVTPLWFPVVHLLRDIAWVSAMVAWAVRRTIGRGVHPSQSMRTRKVVRLTTSAKATAVDKPDTTTDIVRLKPDTTTDNRALIVIPAFNEARNLPTVVSEIREMIPNAPVLVVDDGSTDETERVLAGLNLRRVRLPERMGIGTAMRVGLRYAVRQGFDVVVRLDGDGQHRPKDVERLLAIVQSGEFDMAFGSRSSGRRARSDQRRGALKRALAACLSLLTGRRVLDATCGLVAMGPDAVRLFAELHPTGYPEPELRLLVSRTSLTSIDVEVVGRPRLSGKTSLTPFRVMRAAARVILAMYVVPFRSINREPAGD